MHVHPFPSSVTCNATHRFIPQLARIFYVSCLKSRYCAHSEQGSCLQHSELVLSVALMCILSCPLSLSELPIDLFHPLLDFWPLSPRVLVLHARITLFLVFCHFQRHPWFWFILSPKNLILFHFSTLFTYIKRLSFLYRHTSHFTSRLRRKHPLKIAHKKALTTPPKTRIS